MPERAPLSDEANDALRRARATAGQHGHERSDDLHIVLALFESARARELLELFGAEVDRLRSAVEFLVRDVPFQGDAEERTVERAQREAARLGHEQTEPEHLLVALVSEPTFLLIGMFESIGLTRDAGREATRFLHRQVGDWEKPEAALGYGRSDFGPMEIADAVSNEEGARLAEMMSAFQPMLTPLRRVVAIGQSREVSGVLLELLALEDRDATAILYWHAQSQNALLLGPPRLVISDSAGTRYTVLPSEYSSTEHESRGQTRIVPAPPLASTWLRVEVARFGRFGPPSLRPPAGPSVTEVDGPWRFDVPLQGNSARATSEPLS